ncbi:MAG: O-methyltransferase [candidate division Zixibacteria bacterium]
MFNNIHEKIIARMKYLEEADSKDRDDGTPRLERLRQITPDTGKFLAILAASVPSGEIIEIGTSGGYSTLWLALACRAIGRKVTTFEILGEKVKVAEETFQEAEVTDVVNLVQGDAAGELKSFEEISFCFLDAEKEDYQKFYDLIVPRLVPGGLLVADNLISHSEELKSFADAADSDERVDSVVVPIGKGELVCRKN